MWTQGIPYGGVWRPAELITDRALPQARQKPGHFL